ncbi:hypothetical protein QBC47DRAFT_387502 [Echria macrotheca]|uniref:Uncharacterized protein n=1 Tax=Echria macrotheca TaxID=438768 RepID=A0AAJ0F9B4_9PEZI|nr:hypothetical protein QBC47DRAFT_387502 [Echria macrotheca]
MDWLWSDHQVQSEDLRFLKVSATPLTEANRRRHWTGKVWRIDSTSNTWSQAAAQNQRLNVTGHTSFDNTEQWTTWADNQTLQDPSNALPQTHPELEHLSIVISSLVNLTGFNNKLNYDDATALRYTIMPTDLLLSTAQKLHLHRGYFSLIESANPCAIKLTGSIQERPCEFYLLRTSNALTFQSAITITHFPKHTVTANNSTITLGARTNVFISGYTADTLAQFTSHITRSSSFPSAPDRIITAFLEIENKLRFSSVRAAVRDMQTVLQELAREPVTEAPSARQKLLHTVDLYFVVHHLRTDGLVAWRDQLLSLSKQLQEDGQQNQGPGNGQNQVTNDDKKHLRRYIDQLVSQYDHRIGRCDMVLQGASLAYQMETAQLSRKDTEIAIGDGKTMKAIAVLTMIFLPGTFIATMLAVPQIEDALKPENDGSFGDQKWKWYIVLAIPLTVAALVIYAVWEFLYKRKYLKALFGERDGEADNGVGEYENIPLQPRPTGDLEAARGL